MKRSKNQTVAFKVAQAVGAMAIENVQLSRDARARMLRVARGSEPASVAIDALVEQYRQVEPVG